MVKKEGGTSAQKLSCGRDERATAADKRNFDKWKGGVKKRRWKAAEGRGKTSGKDTVPD